MSDIEFSINLPAPTDKLIELATSFEDYPQYLESSIKSVKILEKTNNETITEEILIFRSLFSHEIIQKSKHTMIGGKQTHSEIIFGPFKGTIIDVLFEKKESGTKVSVNADYKISLKYKILSPIIKQKYKIILTGFLYKMNAKLI
ncbi:type II toxin-antitoxin system RatA family toxin [Nitrosopumilus sp.]|uniref:type II toxin-antitoxin system RatA family toxin n=1 Tax=Nitrosopumilus sp. TaxID=2024843 RepID=UPI0034A07ACB